MSRSRSYQKRRRNRYVSAWDAAWRAYRDDVRTGLVRTRVPPRRSARDRMARNIQRRERWERRTLFEPPWLPPDPIVKVKPRINRVDKTRILIEVEVTYP